MSKEIRNWSEEDARRLADEGILQNWMQHHMHLEEEFPRIDDGDFEEACWICEVLEKLLPEIPTRPLIAALAEDPEAFRLIECELLGLQAKIMAMNPTKPRH
ncbi:hypothetical protein KC865_01195 [Candidatus Kaiserbacteria bacterium]|nr:hypothetical protein [Candidatus Kaiserbacteria bacterium]USN92380.1 MAG: hypothetical protein H6782_01025 [Candidatus Nomurabacteria bacterium]